MNVPKLRFPGFEGEWTPFTLGELTELSDGTHFTPDYKVEGIPFWSVETITSNAPVKYISQEEHESIIKRCYPQKNDILITRISSGINSLGVPKLIDWDGEFSIYVSVGLIKANTKFDSRFITEYLTSPNYKREFLSKSLLTAAPKKINMDSLGTTTIKLPSLGEQIKIGKYMNIFNKKIQLQQEKIDLLKEQKKGFMQKIFSQELRFKNEDGTEFPEWVNVKLGDILILLKDGTHGTHKDVDKGPYLLSAKNIKNGMVQINDNDRKISFSEYQSIYKNYQLKKGDILLTIVGSIGEVAIYQSDRENVAFQRSVAVLRTKSDFNSLYLSYIMQSTDFQKALKIFQVVSAQPGIYLGDLSKIKINISLNQSEQLKVSSFLSKVDKKINLELQKIKELNKQKHSLMQQMFI